MLPLTPLLGILLLLFSSTEGTTIPTELSCAANIAKSEMDAALCQKCGLSKVYLVIGKNWQNIPFKGDQRTKALGFFEQIDKVLPFSNFTMGFTDSMLCFGSNKISVRWR